MTSKPKMLIVDDVQINAALLSGIFESNYEIYQANSAKKAMQTLQSGKVSFDIILLDITSDSQASFDLLRQIKDHSLFGIIPVVVSTKQGEDDLELKALSLGAADFISRPYNPQVVVQRVKNIVSQQVFEDLRFYYEHDMLTGIYNRQTFCQKAGDLLAKNPDERFVLVSWDIENFKIINDIFGTETGDSVLKQLADLLVQITHSHGVCGRLEADNFVTCIPEGLLNIPQFVQSVANISKALSMGFDMRVCLGIYEIANRQLPVNHMCDRANLALDTIKGNFLNQYAYYDETMRQSLLQQQQMISEMDEALKQEQFVIYLQPVYSVSQNAPVSAEVLVRWQHPKKGLIGPGTFIPIFEKNGFISKLDFYVWEKACQLLAQLRLQGLPEIPLSINVSRVNLYNPDLCQLLLNLLDQYSLDPSVLRLEITETAYMENPHQLLVAVNNFRRHGFMVLMDDFGSGYSSLNMLKDIPVDVVKIDMQFLSGLGESDRAGSVINSVVRMARWLEMNVIAEGVETKEQRDFLASIGCDYIQGYFYAKPIPADQYAKLLKPGVEKAPDQVSCLSQSALELMGDINRNNSLISKLVGPIAIYERHGNEIEVVQVNDAYYNLTGSTPATIYKDTKQADSWLFEEDKSLFLQNLIVAQQTGKTQVVKLRRYHQNKNVLWLRAHISFLGSHMDRCVYCAILENITETEKIKRENALSGYGESLRSIYDMVYQVDFKNQMVSVLYHEHCGGLPDHSMQFNACVQAISAAIHPQDVDDFLQFYAAQTLQYNFSTLKKKSASFCGRVKDESGEYHWFVNTIVPVLEMQKKAILSCVRFIDQADSENLHRAKGLTLSDVPSQTSVSHMAMDCANTVLVVDDNQINRMMLKKMLGDSYHVLEAGNGKQALEILKQNQGQIAAILLDIVMPIMDGYEFLILRKQSALISSVPVLVLSQADSKDSEIKALQLGASDFLKKPYEPRIILQRLRNLVALQEAIQAKTTVESIIENLPGGVSILEVQENSVTMRYISYSAAEESGYTQREYLSMSGEALGEILHQQDRRMLFRKLKKAAKDHQGMSADFRLCRKDGSTIWVRMAANFVNTVGEISVFYASTHDITDQKYAQLQLAERTYELEKQQKKLNKAYDKLQTAFDLSDMQMFEYDIPRDTIKLTPKLAARFGWPTELRHASEYLARNKIDLFGDSHGIGTVFYRLRQGESPVETEAKLQNSAGQIEHKKITYTTVFDDMGVPATAIGVSRDITDEVLVRQRYEQEASYRKSLTQDTLAFFEVDLVKGKLISCSVGSALPFDPYLLSADQLTTRMIDLCVNPADVDLVRAMLSEQAAKTNIKLGKASHYLECKIQSLSQAFEGYRWAAVSINYIKNPVTQHHHVFVSVKDIHESKTKQLHMMERAQRDSLTGLFNRAVFEELVSANLENHIKTGSAGAFILLDLDCFKSINDTFGHAYGDHVLQCVSKVLSGMFREGDIIARMGGDELSVFMSGIPTVQLAAQKGSEICSRISSYTDEKLMGPLSCSVGVALFPKDATSFQELYHSADLALYKAKSKGKNQSCVYGGDVQMTPSAYPSMQNSQLVEAIDTPVYISDTAQFDMLYMNKSAMTLCKISSYEGKKCYQIIFGRTSPCPFCKNKQLTSDQFYQWEQYSPHLNQKLLAKDRLITWQNRCAKLCTLTTLHQPQHSAPADEELPR